MKNNIFYSCAWVGLLMLVLSSISWSQEKSSASVVPTPPANAMPTAVSTPSAETGAKSGAPLKSYPRYGHVHVDGPYVALTFDDGPSATLTPRLLDILKEHHAKATFFIIGERAQRNSEILAREVQEGHEVGNHTWDHITITKLSDAQFDEEIQKTNKLITDATGEKPTLFRPPGGAINRHFVEILANKYGMKSILWSVDPLDWKRPGSSVVAQRLIAGTTPGAITISHDIKLGTIEAMPEVLDALQAKGYKFVTVSELIALETKAPATAPTVKSVASTQKKGS
ncbi:MAG: polysaccharide deacetylase family protein [Chthoniobacterales bacterium]